MKTPGGILHLIQTCHWGKKKRKHWILTWWFPWNWWPPQGSGTDHFIGARTKLPVPGADVKRKQGICHQSTAKGKAIVHHEAAHHQSPIETCVPHSAKRRIAWHNPWPDWYLGRGSNFACDWKLNCTLELSRSGAYHLRFIKSYPAHPSHNCWEPHHINHHRGLHIHISKYLSMSVY